MDFDEQVQSLIQNAPQDGRTPELVRAIAPVLQELTRQLTHEHYYILQGQDQRWLTTVLSKRNQPQEEKTVIYAYGFLEDARAHSGMAQDSSIMAIPVPIVHILFQLIAMQPVDSLLFFEVSGDLKSAVEVTRQDLQDSIRAKLQNYQHQRRTAVPPDLA